MHEPCTGPIEAVRKECIRCRCEVVDPIVGRPRKYCHECTSKPWLIYSRDAGYYRAYRARKKAEAASNG